MPPSTRRTADSIRTDPVKISQENSGVFGDLGVHCVDGEHVWLHITCYDGNISLAEAVIDGTRKVQLPITKVEGLVTGEGPFALPDTDLPEFLAAMTEKNAAAAEKRNLMPGFFQGRRPSSPILAGDESAGAAQGTPAERPRPRPVATPKATQINALNKQKEALEEQIAAMQSRISASKPASETRLVAELEAVGLSAFVSDLVKARITSIASLKRHTIGELQASLARKTIKGEKFIFSMVERRQWAELGLGLQAAA